MTTQYVNSRFRETNGSDSSLPLMRTNDLVIDLRFDQSGYFRPDGLFRSGKPITIVVYHSVSNEPESDDYTVSPGVFYRQIQFIRNNFSVVRLNEVENVIKGECQSSRHVAITFDDAYGDFLEFAYPVLEKLGVPATVFVPTAFIGHSNQWDLLNNQCSKKRVMNRRELQDLHKTGLVDFGSHSVDHQRMTRLPIDEMKRQAAESKRTLENLLETRVTMFAYPYGQLGDFSALTTQVLLETGYKVAVTTHWGTRNSRRDLLRLCRISFRESDSDSTVRARIEGIYDWIAVKEQVGFLLRRLRRALPGGV